MDTRDKVITKVAKLKAMMESAAKIGSEAEAEAFAAAVNKLMLQHELSDAEILTPATEEPILEVEVDRTLHELGLKKSRVAWTEILADIVADAHLCRFLVCKGTNRVWFVGTKRHADIAAYMYGTMARSLERIATSAYNKYCREIYERDGSMKAARGFKQSFILGFLGRLGQRYQQERKQAVQEAAQGASLALIHLSNALTRADAHMAGKKMLDSTNLRKNQHHHRGYEEGISAADKLRLDSNGIEASSRKGLQPSQ